MKNILGASLIVCSLLFCLPWVAGDYRPAAITAAAGCRLDSTENHVASVAGGVDRQIICRGNGGPARVRVLRD